MENFKSRYFRGQGSIFLGDLDSNNNPSNLVFIGDMASAELTPEVERSNVIENRTGGNAVAADWVKAVRYNFSARMRSVEAKHLAQALQADLTTKTGTTVTDEAHTGHHDAHLALLHTNVSSVIVTNDTGATTYTAGTDYVLHADEGLIEILSTGTITDAQALLIDYTYATQHHLATNPSSLEKCLVFSGVNSADNNKKVRCEVYKIKLDPSVLSLITDEATDMPLSGLVQTASARPAGDQLYSWKLQD